MTVSGRVRLSLALFAAALGAVLLLHAWSMRRVTRGTRSLAALAARQQAADEGLRRVEDMSVALQKYAVTGDPGYLERLASLARVQGELVRALEIQPLTAAERSAGRDLAAHWDRVSGGIDSVVIDGRLGNHRPTPSAARRGADQVSALAIPLGALAAASRFEMLDEIRRVHRRSAASARLFWIVAAGATMLVVALTTLLGRSIVRPLERLAAGTRALAGGQLGVRVPVGGGSDELAGVARDFNDMSIRLEQLDRMKRDFISNVSHDLKSPLSAMQEAIDALLDGLAGPVGERQRRLLEISRDSGKRLASMIHKLLDLSRLDSRPTPVRDLLDLSALSQRAVDHVSAGRDLRGRGPRVVIEPSAGHLLLRADAEEISQLLDNLLENALRFSPPDGVVRVALEDEDGVAVLRVSDEGPGVPDAEKHRVFERFYQVEGARIPSDHGVGLGLAICRQVVEAHGGTIVVRDNLPRGAVFEVRIPGAIHLPATHASPPAELFA